LNTSKKLNRKNGCWSNHTDGNAGVEDGSVGMMKIALIAVRLCLPTVSENSHKKSCQNQQI
jgi:hypothetical protein